LGNTLPSCCLSCRCSADSEAVMWCPCAAALAAWMDLWLAWPLIRHLLGSSAWLCISSCERGTGAQTTRFTCVFRLVCALRSAGCWQCSGLERRKTRPQLKNLYSESCSSRSSKVRLSTVLVHQTDTQIHAHCASRVRQRAAAPGTGQAKPVCSPPFTLSPLQAANVTSGLSSLQTATCGAAKKMQGQGQQPGLLPGAAGMRF
jgi:hypothetical protein